MGCHFLLQGIFPTQGPNPSLPHWRQILHHLSHTILMHETSVCMLSHFSCVQLSATLRTVDCQAHLFMGFSRQEWESGLPFPPPGDLPDPGTEPRSPILQEDSLPSEPPGKPKNIGVGSLSLLQRIFGPRNGTGVSCIAGRFFTS